MYRRGFLAGYNANSERTFVNDSLWKGADRSKLQWRVCVNLRLDKDGLGRVGRFLLKKVPGAGWAVSAGDVAIVVAGCR